MAKGLSTLQKTILQLAMKNSGIRSNNCGVSNREVLIEYYGFEPCCETEGKRNRTQIFDRQKIGLNHYKSDSVSVVRAFNRLAERGLAHRKHNYGIILTEEGRKVAKELLLKC
jgi:hypothetical protein